jgi:hypothetical protein
MSENSRHLTFFSTSNTNVVGIAMKYKLLRQINIKNYKFTLIKHQERHLAFLHPERGRRGCLDPAK